MTSAGLLTQSTSSVEALITLPPSGTSRPASPNRLLQTTRFMSKVSPGTLVPASLPPSPTTVPSASTNPRNKRTPLQLHQLLSLALPTLPPTQLQATLLFFLLQLLHHLLLRMITGLLPTTSPLERLKRRPRPTRDGTRICNSGCSSSGPLDRQQLHQQQTAPKMISKTNDNLFLFLQKKERRPARSGTKQTMQTKEKKMEQRQEEQGVSHCQDTDCFLMM